MAPWDHDPKVAPDAPKADPVDPRAVRWDLRELHADRKEDPIALTVIDAPKDRDPTAAPEDPKVDPADPRADRWDLTELHADPNLNRRQPTLPKRTASGPPSVSIDK